MSFLSCAALLQFLVDLLVLNQEVHRIFLEMVSYHSLSTRLACRSVGIFYRVTDTSLQATQLLDAYKYKLK